MRNLSIVHFLLVISLSCQSPRNSQSKEQYIIVWKYEVKPEHISAFEKEYGSTGTWVNLFNQSKDYYGSILNKSDEKENAYLLIDQWANKETYERFKEKNRAVYDSLSDQFAHFHISEEKVGSFTQLP